jgi:hypothetical protein
VGVPEFNPQYCQIKKKKKEKRKALELGSDDGCSVLWYTQCHYATYFKMVKMLDLIVSSHNKNNTYALSKRSFTLHVPVPCCAFGTREQRRQV